MTRYRSSVAPLVALCAASSLLFTAGCATKKYVRSQVQPLVQQTNELNQVTAQNHREIQDVDKRAQSGIQQAQGAAQTAQQSADSAGQSAQQAMSKTDALSGIVSNLDNYQPVAQINVTFGFNKAILTSADKSRLDQLASQMGSTKGYIVALTGSTDSTGSKAYNDRLSQRRAQAVERYLAATYHVPPYKFYVLGLGKADEVASNRTAAGRAKNRRVQVQLLTNMSNTPAGDASGQTQSQSQSPAQSQSQTETQLPSNTQ
jgi:OOP family OmpA-OmpF porin